MLKDGKTFIPKIGESMKTLRKHSPGTFDGYGRRQSTVAALLTAHSVSSHFQSLNFCG